MRRFACVMPCNFNNNECGISVVSICVNPSGISVMFTLPRLLGNRVERLPHCRREAGRILMRRVGNGAGGGELSWGRGWAMEGGEV